MPANAASIEYSWYRSTDGGNNYDYIDNSNNKTYTTSPVTKANNGYLYFCNVEYPYPNPANPDTNFYFVLASSEDAALTVIDAPASGSEDIPNTGDSPLGYICAGVAVLAFAAFAVVTHLYRRKRTEV